MDEREESLLISLGTSFISGVMGLIIDGLRRGGETRQAAMDFLRESLASLQQVQGGVRGELAAHDAKYDADLTKPPEGSG